MVMTTAQEIIHRSIERFGQGLVLSTSLQKGGMVVLDTAVKVNPSLRIITLDTGRLPEETFTMIEKLRDRYGVKVELVYPDGDEVGRMVMLHGPNLFYHDVASRRLCCQIRKVRPWNLKLAGVDAVMTGLRRDQGESRQDVEQLDESAGLVKINPLAHWSDQDVEAYTALHNLPVHPLYSLGYTSIGCAPCTRATAEGGRSGRWWWENEADKECGIHFSAEGQARRNLDVMLDEIVIPKD
jgi:phosphoadenosine phosphosulfate reductase